MGFTTIAVRHGRPIFGGTTLQHPQPCQVPVSTIWWAKAIAGLQLPHGYPWLSNDNKQKVQLADDLVQKSFHGCALTRDHGGHFFLEHPEQLGLTAGQIPASIWDLPEAAELLCQKGVRTFAIFSVRVFCAFFQTHAFYDHTGSFGSRLSWFIST